MPQLDKLSFSTQYFWLTLFFFILYFICTNFFVIIIFKSLKLRNIIYKIWYFFVFKFDYSKYESKSKSLSYSSFNSTYSIFYNNFFVFLKKTSSLIKFFILGKKLDEVNYINTNLNSVNLASLTVALNQINNVDIDAI